MRTATAQAVPTVGSPANARERADGQPPQAPAQTTDQDRKAAFLAEATAPGVALDRPYLHAGSAYQLQAGTVIPAALLTGINTDLPGDVGVRSANRSRGGASHANGERQPRPLRCHVSLPLHERSRDERHHVLG
jgi:hypothetical protein